MPVQFKQVSDYEEEFGQHHELGRPKTIHRKLTVGQRASEGSSMLSAETSPAVVLQALSKKYDGSIILNEGEWKLPSGAFKETGGPT